MDSKVDSLLPTEVTPFPLPVPIRAPLSTDSDTENAIDVADSSSGNNNGSISGSGSDQGFHSGVEEFETASERAFFVEPDEEIAEKEASEEDDEPPFMEPSAECVEVRMPKTMPVAKVSKDEEDHYVDETLQNESTYAHLLKENEEFKEFEGDATGDESKTEIDVISSKEKATQLKVADLEGDEFSDSVKGKLLVEEDSHEFYHGIAKLSMDDREHYVEEAPRGEELDTHLLKENEEFKDFEGDITGIEAMVGTDLIYPEVEATQFKVLDFNGDSTTDKEKGKDFGERDGHDDGTVKLSVDGEEQYSEETAQDGEIDTHLLKQSDEFKEVADDTTRSEAMEESIIISSKQEAIQLKVVDFEGNNTGDKEKFKAFGERNSHEFNDGIARLSIDDEEYYVEEKYQGEEPDTHLLKENVVFEEFEGSTTESATTLGTVLIPSKEEATQSAETNRVDFEGDNTSVKVGEKPFEEGDTHEFSDGIPPEDVDDKSIVSSVSKQEMEITQFLAGVKENQSDDNDKICSSSTHRYDRQNLAMDNTHANSPLEDSIVASMNEKKLVEAREVPDEKTMVEDESPKVIQEVRLLAEEHGDYSSDDNRGTEEMIFGNVEIAEQFLGDLDQASGGGSRLGLEHFLEHADEIDGQIITDSDDDLGTDDDGDGKELFDANALAALLKAATGDGDGGSITLTSQDGSQVFSLERPAGLGTSFRPLRPSMRPTQPTQIVASDDKLSEEEKRKLEIIQELRVKFLRLVHRLGYLPEDSIAQQVLYKMTLAAGRSNAGVFSFDTAKREALRLEREKSDLDFSVNILVLGKTGVGKSATVNSIFGEERVPVNSFEPSTTSVKELVEVVDGVKIRVFDTPGLSSSFMEQGFNTRVLNSIKRTMKNAPPDVVLYVDRLDMQSRDFNDFPLLKSVTSVLGSSVWRNAVVTLTHAASALPDGPSGSPLSYEVAVAQRAHIVQQAIGQAVGDLRLMNPSLMNPVTLVENHTDCEKNRDGQRVLPSGQSWRPQLLLLCYSMKILSDVTSLSRNEDLFDQRKLFGFRVRSPPLPYLLSGLLQSRNHPKLATDGENADSDVDLDDGFSASDEEDEEDEYDQLPPFKPLRKWQIAKLSKEQRKAYLDEYDYRVKLFHKKLWREEIRRMRERKKGKGKVSAEEEMDPESEPPSAVPVALPDMALPPSFDGDNPAYRYRFLEPSSQFLARPVLDTHGWDHDCGYDGVNVEQGLAIAGRFPSSVSLQITKDKKEFHIQLDSSVSAKHGENGSTMAGFDIQNMGKQVAYVIRGETKFKSFKKNKTSAGGSVTFLGENIAPGFKIEDQISFGKWLVLTGSTGTVRSKGDVAYGANLEIRLRDADYPIGQDGSTLGLSMVKWRNDLALGANLQSQFSIGRSSRMAVRAALNNKLSGQISVRTTSSEQLQIAIAGLLPIAMSVYKNFWPGATGKFSIC